MEELIPMVRGIYLVITMGYYSFLLSPTRKKSEYTHPKSLEPRCSLTLKVEVPLDATIFSGFRCSCRVTGLKIELLGETSIASTISYLDNAVVYIGSSYGDSQVQRSELLLLNCLFLKKMD